MSSTAAKVTAPVSTAKTKKAHTGTFTRQMAWFAMLFVVASIVTSSIMVYFGSDNQLAKLALIPQVLFVLVLTIYKFSFAK